MERIFQTRLSAGQSTARSCHPYHAISVKTPAMMETVSAKRGGSVKGYARAAPAENSQIAEANENPKCDAIKSGTVWKSMPRSMMTLKSDYECRRHVHAKPRPCECSQCVRWTMPADKQDTCRKRCADAASGDSQPRSPESHFQAWRHWVPAYAMGARV